MVKDIYIANDLSHFQDDSGVLSDSVTIGEVEYNRMPLGVFVAIWCNLSQDCDTPEHAARVRAFNEISSLVPAEWIDAAKRTANG